MEDEGMNEEKCEWCKMTIRNDYQKVEVGSAVVHIECATPAREHLEYAQKVVEKYGKERQWRLKE